MTLKMTTAQVVETSVTVTNSSFQNYTHPDDHATRTTDTPGFKPFTMILYTAVPFTLVLRYGRMSATLKEAKMCNRRKGGGKQGENRTRPERMNGRKREVQAERIWVRKR